MCVIAVKLHPQGTRISEDRAERMFDRNKDGMGITYLDNFDTRKTLDKDLAIKWVTGNRPFVAHFRLKTSGAVCIKNTHPIDIDEDHKFFFNGVVNKYANYEGGDTAGLAAQIRGKPRHLWPKILKKIAIGRKFAIVARHGTGGKVCMVGKFECLDSVWYSNTYFSYNRTGYHM